jgi:hypothetical protein
MAHYSVSSCGTLAYLPGGVTPERQYSLMWLNRRGDVERAIPRPINTIYSHLSPDERQVLLGTSIYDFTRGTLTSLKVSPRMSLIWHPDGQRLTGMTGPTERQLAWMAADGTGTPRPLPTTERGAPMSWSPNGKMLAYLKDTANSTSSEIWLLTLADGDGPAVARRLVADPVRYGRAEFSPDGGYLAYESPVSGRMEVYVQPVSETGGRFTISNNGGGLPAWAGHGRELFYWEAPPDGNTRLMVVDVKLGERFSAGAPRALFEIRSADYPPGVAPIRAYDVTRDGTRVLMAQVLRDSIEPPITQIVVVQNWLDELKRMTPDK